MISFVVRALVEFTVIRQSCAVLVLSSSIWDCEYVATRCLKGHS